MVPRRGSDRVSRVIGVNGVHRQNPRGFYPFELVSMLRECVHENCGPPRQLVQGGRKQEELLGVQVMEREERLLLDLISTRFALTCQEGLRQSLSDQADRDRLQNAIRRV